MGFLVPTLSVTTWKLGGGGCRIRGIEVGVVVVAGCPAFSSANEFGVWYANFEAFVLSFQTSLPFLPSLKKSS